MTNPSARVNPVKNDAYFATCLSLCAPTKEALVCEFLLLSRSLRLNSIFRRLFREFVFGEVSLLFGLNLKIIASAIKSN